MKRLVTGIQATGEIHLGNYFGAIRQVVALQHTHESFVFVADLHALNTQTDGSELRRSALNVAKAYVAAGFDPEKGTLFRQSAVPEHAELAIILGPHTSHGLLERAHAYKDAIAHNKAIHAGLYFYPVLMAADILLYNADVVPVGADQQQHLEMTREIAERFNHVYGKVFHLPQPILMGGDDNILKGIDGRKMSKSYGNQIGLFDLPEVVRAKVAKIVTDSKRPDEPKDPKTDTIFSIYKHVAEASAVDELANRYRAGTIGYKEAKDLLTEAINHFVAPFIAKKAELDANEGYIQRILDEGADRAGEKAHTLLTDIKERTGLLH